MTRLFEVCQSDSYDKLEAFVTVGNQHQIEVLLA